MAIANLTKSTVAVNNITALSDTPNATEGLTAAQLKAKFDKTGSDEKTFLNDTLIPEIDSAIDTLEASIATKATEYFSTTAARYSLGTGQDNLTQATYTLINLDTKITDLGNNFNTTDHYYNVPTAGYYFVGLSVEMVDTGGTAAKRIAAKVLKNSTTPSDEGIVFAISHTSLTTSVYITNCSFIYLAANDKLRLYAKSDGDATTDIVGGAGTRLDVYRIA